MNADGNKVSWATELGHQLLDKGVIAMRIELVYRPGSDTYKSVQKMLEDVIAEERLPIPVELIEDKDANFPSIRIDGHIVDKKGIRHTFEYLRDLISHYWAELTQMRHIL
jgi:hypothetical protein